MALDCIIYCPKPTRGSLSHFEGLFGSDVVRYPFETASDGQFLTAQLTSLAAGHDKQLETGVQIALEELKQHPIPSIPARAYLNYHKEDGLGK